MELLPLLVHLGVSTVIHTVGEVSLPAWREAIISGDDD